MQDDLGKGLWQAVKSRENLCRKALTTLATSVGQNSASAHCGAACSESMATFTHQATGLVCPFHTKLFDSNFNSLCIFYPHVKT